MKSSLHFNHFISPISPNKKKHPAMGSTCAHSRCCGLCDGAVDGTTDVGRPNQVRKWQGIRVPRVPRVPGRSRLLPFGVDLTWIFWGPWIRKWQLGSEKSSETMIIAIIAMILIITDMVWTPIVRWYCPTWFGTVFFWTCTQSYSRGMLVD